MRPLGAAAAVLTRAERAGLRLRLRPDGRVRVEADAPPPHDLLEELRRYRDELAALLAEREKRPGRETPPPSAPGPSEAEAEAAPAPEAAEAMAAPGVPHCPGGVPGGGTDRDREAVRLLHLAAAGAAALAEPDADLDAERAVMAKYYAAEPSDRPYVPGDPDPLRDGLLAGARGWVLTGGRRMRAAGARHVSSGRAEKRGYTPARRPIPAEERLEGRTGPAAGSEFRRE